jgi:release factor glutamine methyltransferase
MYAPREDSYLLQTYVRQYAKGKVLDMGTGSGIQAMAALENNNVISVIGADIDEEVIKLLKDKCRKDNKENENKYNPESNKIKKIKFTVSDLFSSIKNEKFDTVIFNPPYLPEEEPKDVALDGGKKGYELIERFFNEVKNYLDKNGIILIVFSSLTNKNKVHEIIKQNRLSFKLLEERKLFFEKLYVYLIFEK